MLEGNCHHCGDGLQYSEKVFRNDTCPSCGSDVYCCMNCLEFEESYPNQCKEPQAERAILKDHRNFCEYFALSKGRQSSRGAEKAAEARKKLEALFKK
jgi:hypothetical protein